MNPKLAALLVVGGIAVVAALVALVLVVIDRRAGVRRKAYNAAMDALADIEVEADRYSELDSVLAGAVKTRIRDLHRKQRELRL